MANHDGEARAVDRYTLSDLPGMKFYQYVYSTLPVVFTLPFPANEDENESSEAVSEDQQKRWNQLRRNLRNASFDHRSHRELCMTEEGCSMKYADVCYSESCRKAGHISPGFLAPVFEFPGPLPKTYFMGPGVFTGFEGHKFGAANHIDSLCQGQVSIQYEGTKKWTLWSPSGWEVPEIQDHFASASNTTMITAHTRFETILRAGEVLFFAPGWLHETEILEGSSLSATYSFSNPPVGGGLAKDHHANSPYGYDNCAQGPDGWTAANGLWRKIIEDFDLSPDTPGGALFIERGVPRRATINKKRKKKKRKSRAKKKSRSSSASVKSAQ
eukprot:CAMPEP_0170198376 /NCGR_PEP_ID=MMETSP0040_2-20121228/68691_1 /TAXON_ID=641309 /ORGANISM="Lotharella oceanica, Strain CCMP622" /LENGTH=327 /DNA_ID=CAMNT_0010448319 /DNA_START=25 /DNA_END=1005 /DNA_ORIENTATION=-